MKKFIALFVSWLLVIVCVPFFIDIEYLFVLVGLWIPGIISTVLFKQRIHPDKLDVASWNLKISSLILDILYCLFWFLVFSLLANNVRKSISVICFYWGFYYFISKDSAFNSIGMTIKRIGYNNAHKISVKLKIIAVNFFTQFPIWLIFFLTHFTRFTPNQFVYNLIVVSFILVIGDYCYMIFIDKEYRFTEKILKLKVINIR